ncbi:MAG: RNA methyltransferase [Crocinitomicaceae bacterium]|nr:RNA methyltransferase [Crocinitomicaceae bacterium]
MESAFVVEGSKMVHEIINNWSDHIVCLCTTDEAFKSEFESYFVSSPTMKELSTLHSASDILAVVRKPSAEISEPKFILAIDGVQDPGNLGTMIRTADWFGVDKIVCSKETVDVFNSKVIQSSMGSLFRIPIEYTDLQTYLSDSSLPIYGALLEGESMYDSKLDSNAIVLLGNEGNGISENLRSLVSNPILIPGKGQAESLNVAVATGVILAEFAKD